MKRLFALGAVFALVAGVALAVHRDTGTRLTIHLTSAAGIFAGSDVRVLGVKIGTVTRVTPEGQSVRVELTYDHPAPADAVAVVVQPTLVGERYVQLAPAYQGGPVLADGADLPTSRTATPVEPDELFRALDELGTALGPGGANNQGALARLIGTGRRNLDGNGTALNSTIRAVAKVARSAAEGSGDVVATVRDLEKVTAALGADDGSVRTFAADLAAVGAQLDDEKADLAVAVRTLTVALAQLAEFVKENGETLRGNVRALTDLSAVLVRQKDALATFLDVAPTALANLQRAYDPTTGSLAVRDSGCTVPGVCAPARIPARAAAPGSGSAGLLGGILKETP